MFETLFPHRRARKNGKIAFSRFFASALSGVSNKILLTVCCRARNPQKMTVMVVSGLISNDRTEADAMTPWYSYSIWNKLEQRFKNDSRRWNLYAKAYLS